jgi:hypothetical protein
MKCIPFLPPTKEAAKFQECAQFFPHLMALVSFESNPFKQAPLEIFLKLHFEDQFPA